MTKGVAKEKTSGFPLVCEGGCSVQAEARLNVGPIGKGSPIGVRRAMVGAAVPLVFGLKSQRDNSDRADPFRNSTRTAKCPLNSRLDQNVSVLTATTCRPAHFRTGRQSRIFPIGTQELPLPYHPCASLYPRQEAPPIGPVTMRPTTAGPARWSINPANTVPAIAKNLIAAGYCLGYIRQS